MNENDVNVTVEKNRAGRCRKCKRILKNPKHIENGIGPVCAKKEAKEPFMYSAELKPQQ